MRAFRRLVFCVSLASLSGLMNCSQKEEKEDQSSESVQPVVNSTTSSCAEIAEEDPKTQSGQLILNVADDIDPCSVDGFIVGKETQLRVEKTTSNTYVINNVPPGQHDVIVTGTLATTGLTSTKRGVRLSDVEAVAGEKTKLGKLALPEVGAITGNVKLVDQDDHSGVHVYIPGTGFDATTDIEGNYTISPFVVVGQQNLFFEKDGYHRGQLEDVTVVEGKTTQASSVVLALSTGSEGFLLLAQGQSTYDSRVVPVVVGMTPDAVLMKISEDIHFISIPWEPIKSTTTYEFDSPGEKKLYLKLANANGLESSAFESSIAIDLFSDGATFSINAGAAITKTRSVSLTIEPPKNAHEMLVSHLSSFSSANWSDVADEIDYEFPDDGENTVYLKFKSKDEFESPTYSSSITVEIFSSTEGSISLNQGALTSSSRTVTATIQVPTYAAKMMLSDVSAFTSAQWIDPNSSASYTFASEGVSVLYLKFKDAEGFESPVWSDGITVDLFGDSEVSFSLDQNTLTTSSMTLALSSMSAPVNGTSLKVAHKSDFASASWQNIATSLNYAVPLDYSLCGSGNHIYLKFKDADGFESQTVSQLFSLTCWQSMSETNRPIGRIYAASAWTGSKMLMWGGILEGLSFSVTNTGGIYDPNANSGAGSWSSISTTNAPDSRDYPVGIWTGSKFVVVGGVGTSDAGGVYNPTSDTWERKFTTGTTNVLQTNRWLHSAVWTGDKILIWGGFIGTSLTNTGKIYNVGADTWSDMSTTNAPAARSRHQAFWTGSKMIVWGGSPHNGYIYDPNADTWTSMSTTNQPNVFVSGSEHMSAAAWTGSKLFVWGKNTGGYYDPSSDTWTTVAASNGPDSDASYVQAVTVGTKIIVWGGYNTAGTYPGSVFDTTTNTWSALTYNDGPTARSGHVALSTGSKMIIWGGGEVVGSVSVSNNGKIFTP